MKINYLKWSLHHVAIHFYMEGEKKREKTKLIWQLKKKMINLSIINKKKAIANCLPLLNFI